MNKHFLKKYKDRQSTTSAPAIPMKKASSECTIESCSDTNQSVYEVVCCSHCSKFENLLESIHKKLEDLKDEMDCQKVATEQLVRQESQSAPVIKYFPICQIQELKQLEEKITTANKDVYESAVSAILCNNVKNIKLLFNIEVMNEINMDGTHNKIALKSFPNFYSTLTGAIAKMPFKGLSPEEMLRKAIGIEKAKFFKRAYRQKKKNSIIS